VHQTLLHARGWHASFWSTSACTLQSMEAPAFRPSGGHNEQSIHPPSPGHLLTGP
ncbi:hypothetical protein KUCAC02_036809, partial [Chaenocephalus aceratus]